MDGPAAKTHPDRPARPGGPQAAAQGPPAAQMGPEATRRIVVRCTPEFFAWFGRLCGYWDCTEAETVAKALIRIADASGFAERPPPRLPRRRETRRPTFTQLDRLLRAEGEAEAETRAKSAPGHDGT